MRFVGLAALGVVLGLVLLPFGMHMTVLAVALGGLFLIGLIAAVQRL